MTLCAVISLCLILNPCFGGCLGEAGEAAKEAVRTILLYDCGSDLEGRYGIATRNLHRILELELSPDK